MDNGEGAGVFLTLKDCEALFPRIKEDESSLSKEERMILLRIEKVLYGSLSVREVEDLFDRASVKPESNPFGSV